MRCFTSQRPGLWVLIVSLFSCFFRVPFSCFCSCFFSLLFILFFCTVCGWCFFGVASCFFLFTMPCLMFCYISPIQAFQFQVTGPGQVRRPNGQLQRYDQNQTKAQTKHRSTTQDERRIKPKQDPNADGRQKNTKKHGKRTGPNAEGKATTKKKHENGTGKKQDLFRAAPSNQ